MAHKLRTLSVALFAVLATSTVATASAASHHFSSEKENTTLTAKAKSNQVFKTTPADKNELTCKKISFEGSTLGPISSEEITVKPAYEECEFTGPLKAFVEPEGCAYIFKGETNEAGHAKMEIECPEGKEIRITLTSVHLKCLALPAQTIEGVHYTNTGEGTGRTIDANVTASGVVSTTEESPAVCGTGVHEGPYSGEIEISGEDSEKKPVGIWTGPQHHVEGTKGATLSATALGTQAFLPTTGDSSRFVKCTEASVAGSLAETTNTSITVEPSYGACKANITGAELTAKFISNGCQYKLTGETAASATPGEHATAHIECPAEKSIEVKVTAANLKCIDIQSQTVHGVRYEQSGTSLKVKATIHGIVSTTTSGCVIEGVVEHNNGYYEGEIELKPSTGELKLKST